MTNLIAEALEVLLEFGPQMARPELDRLIERAPLLDANRAKQLLEEARVIQGWGFALAERAFHGEMSEAEGRKQLGERYPDLRSSTLDHLWYKGGYFAWHG